MKNLKYFCGLVVIAVFLLLFKTSQAQITINSAEQVADSLALLMNSANQKVANEWFKFNNLVSKRNAFAQQIIGVIDNGTNDAYTETKELAESLKKFKVSNQTEEFLVNKDLFTAYTKQLDDVSDKLGRVFNLAEKRKINSPSFIELRGKMEGLENSIAIQRQKYNAVAQSYNIKIKKEANGKFYEKYPNLGIKCYFKSHSGAESAPNVPF